MLNCPLSNSFLVCQQFLSIFRIRPYIINSLPSPLFSQESLSMRRILFGAAGLALLGLLLDVNPGRAQEKLKTNGFGSLSGKVTLDGAIPAVVNLVPKMMLHADKACCLDNKAKPIEKIDQTWIVDPKTKAVQNVMVWVKAPKDTYFEIHPKFMKRKETIVIDQPHCAFLPRVSAYNPVYFDGKQMVATGQQLLIKNSAEVPHNVRANGHPKFNKGFNRNLPPKTALDVLKDLNAGDQLMPQPLPIKLQCDIHTWMEGQLFVFDHPYYALTKADGTFEIPFVPAGAEVSVMAWHEGQGWVLTNKGRSITIKNGKKHKLDFEVKAPAPGN
jgi:hypothetical protein